MGKSVVLIGTQWGDEGKGKIVDLLTDRADAVARFQGGTMQAIRSSLMVKRQFSMSFRQVFCETKWIA